MVDSYSTVGSIMALPASPASSDTSTIDANGRQCNCGNYGCLEAYASGPAIATRAREALGGGESSLLPGMVNGDLTRITAQTVYEAAENGDSRRA